MGHVLDWGKFCPVCRNFVCDAGRRPRDMRYPGGHDVTCVNRFCRGCTLLQAVGSDSDDMGGRRIRDGDGHFSETEYPTPSDAEGSSPRNRVPPYDGWLDSPPDSSDDSDRSYATRMRQRPSR